MDHLLKGIYNDQKSCLSATNPLSPTAGQRKSLVSSGGVGGHVGSSSLLAASHRRVAVPRNKSSRGDLFVVQGSQKGLREIKRGDERPMIADPKELTSTEIKILLRQMTNL
ncbi:hypothetical protein E2542_SST03055 [Spatholobus suberectus]|nr:hypothetical protein E2542_SST03055 [Spatholobus suberectus]